LGWLGLVANVGVGAALPFFSKPGTQAGPAKLSQPAESVVERVKKKRVSRERPAQVPAPPLAGLYSLNIETL
jgi:hypothetical protein